MTRPYMAPQSLKSSLPKAVGYLRLDLTGTDGEREELELLALAGRHDYDLLRTLRFGPDVREPVERLLIVVRRLHVSAVLTPSLEHIGTALQPIRQVCHLLIGSPESFLPRLDDFHSGR